MTKNLLQPMDSCCPTWVHWLQQIFSHLALNQIWIEISAWNFQHLFITCLRKFDKKILAIAQSACQPQPISAKTLDASSDRICWDISKRKKLVRFWTYWSNLLKGFFNISKKMPFLIFLKSLWVHLHDVHALAEDFWFFSITRAEARLLKNLLQQTSKVH